MVGAFKSLDMLNCACLCMTVRARVHACIEMSYVAKISKGGYYKRLVACPVKLFSPFNQYNTVQHNTTGGENGKPDTIKSCSRKR